MKAPGSLSPEQKHSFASTYTFLRGATVYLEAVQPIVRAEDRLHIDNLLNFDVLCMSRRVENFDEIAEWEWRGDVL